MRHTRFLIAATALFVTLVSADSAPLGAPGGPGPASSTPPGTATYCRSSATVVADGPNGVTILFQTDASVRDARHTPAPGPPVTYTGAPGEPAATWWASTDRPSPFSVLVRVPDAGRIEAEVLDAALREIGPGGDASTGPAASATDLAEVSEPSIVRGVRLARVTVSPFARAADEGAVAASLTVRISAASEPGVNERTRRPPPLGRAFRRILSRSVINGLPDRGGGATADARGRTGGRDGADYLLIVPDEFEDAVAPLVEWKESKGVRCRVALLSETGPTTQAIRTYISDAYFGWEAPPEYVLLAGDRERIPVHEGLTPTDNFYAAVDGADYLADVLIGRIPAETVEQCAYMVAKSVAYERADVPIDAHWPASAALFLHEDGDNSDVVYHANTEFVRALVDSAGFAPVDTLYTDMTGAGVTQAEVMQVMNEGRGFINYRGSAYAIWPAPFAFFPPNLTNGWNQPVVVSATCATVGYDADHYLSHTLIRAGSQGDPKGAVAFVGTTTSGFGLDRKRGYFDEGFFEHAFGGGRTIAEAADAGKLRLFTLEEDRSEYEGWTVMGDPELNLWTGPREALAVTHDDRIQAGPADLVVRVSSGGEPLAGARVACTLPPEVAVSAVTGESGRAVLSFDVSSAGTLAVVVTARNRVPYEGSVEIVDTGAFVAPLSFTVDDVGGNDDGLVSPGERASIELVLTNSGDEEAESVTAILRTADSDVAVVDSVATYGTVPVGATALPDRAYTIEVDPGRRRDLPIELAALIEYGEWVRLSHLASIDVAAGRLVVASATFDDRAPGGDGDGTADPGETGALTIELANEGECGLVDVESTLTSAETLVAVLAGDAAFADAPPGSLAVNAGSPFIVAIAPEAPTSETATLSLRLSAAGHSYAYQETLDVPVTLEEDPGSLASGPDGYGYYAYDSTDARYVEHPVYDWIDLAPPGPGEHIRYVSSGDDRMRTMLLPFAFTYYGRFDQYISIGSNGVLAIGISEYVFGDNSPIPNLHGPESMVAPFWDDLNPAIGGDVYRWYDEEGHRYVVQYDGVLRADSGVPETFQVILLDPSYHTTPSGDGVIIFQYEDVSEVSECTVGIENQYQDDGIQYAFDGEYDSHAPELADGLAILFTTEPPSSPAEPWLVVREAAVRDSIGGNGNGVAEAGETVSLVFDLENRGTAEATDLTLTLSVEDSVVTVVDGESAMGGIPVGGTGTNEDDPFTLAIPSGAGAATATLWIALGGPAGEAQSALRHDLAVAEPWVAPTLALAPCHPNPFGGGTTLRLELPGGDRASYRVLVRIYNVAGRLVATAFDGELPPGAHDITWDGEGDDGKRAASGVYFIRADAAGATRTRKAVLLR